MKEIKLQKMIPLTVLVREILDIDPHVTIFNDLRKDGRRIKCVCRYTPGAEKVKKLNKLLKYYNYEITESCPKERVKSTPPSYNIHLKNI